MAHQSGYVFRKGHSWFGRWREDAIVNGQLVRRQRCEKLADCSDRFRRESDVRPLLNERLAPINNGRADARSTLSVAEFGESHWLPWARENLKPSTVAGYEDWWAMLKPRLEGTALRDFRTVHAAELLVTLHSERKLGRNSLKHVKSLLSGIFTLARNLGALDSPNPVQGAMIPKKANAPSDTHAATVEEVLGMLDALQNKGEAEAADRLRARVAVALCFFAGLRPGEARGARWEDFDGSSLTIRQSVWHTHATEPKTAASVQAVPVIEPLRSLLAELRQADGSLIMGPILRGPSGKPLNLDNLSRRVVQPILRAAGMTWHGWYSLRRGIATTIASTSKDAMAAKGLLRHTTLATTDRHYIKNVPENTLAAMKSLEAVCNQPATQQAVRPN